jgi:hypothetical protein
LASSLALSTLAFASSSSFLAFSSIGWEWGEAHCRLLVLARRPLDAASEQLDFHVRQEFGSSLAFVSTSQAAWS